MCPEEIRLAGETGLCMEDKCVSWEFKRGKKNCTCLLPAAETEKVKNLNIFSQSTSMHLRRYI